MDDLAGINAVQRNKNIKVQIYLTLLLRGISIFLSFYVVRITIDFLGKDLYGIWIVLLSIISWLALCDIGVGNGLRNRLTIALAKNDLNEARAYISTAYLIISFIALVIFILLSTATYFINWQVVFNNTLLTNSNYKILMIIFTAGIVISFILSLINSILNAYQKSSLTNLGTIITNGLFAIILIASKSFFESQIIRIVLLYCICLILSNFVITAIFFKKNTYIIPKPKYFKKSTINDILVLGGNFFIIQIAALLIFTVDNMLILQMLGTEQVSNYNIVFKLFSIFTIGFGIIISPLWSAFTEAKEKGDFIWMKQTLKKLNMTMGLVIVGLIGIIFFYQPILDLWLPINKQIHPGLMLIFSFTIFILISTWNNIYSFFLNGLGIVRIQVRTAIVGAVINIPLAIIFVKFFSLGLPGIVLSMSLSLFLFSIYGPIEANKFLKQNLNK